jgi:hypothetical protein
MKRYIYISLILTLFSTSCSDKVLNDIDKNPNVLGNAPLNTLLPAAEMIIVQQVAGSSAMIGSGFMSEHTTLTGVTSRIQSEMQLYNGNAWENGFIAIRTLKDIRSKADANKVVGYSAIADILTAYTLSLLVDWYGDIPYTQAADPMGNRQPQFDKAADLYDEMQKLLDSGIQKCDQALTANVRPNKDDLIFGGNMVLWKKTAWGLKARLYNRLSNVNPQETASKALIAINNSFGANENFTVSVYSAVPDNANPLANTFSNSSLQAVGNGIVTAMQYFLDSNEDILNDPRAAIWFTRIGGKVVPGPNGRASTDITLNGTLYSKPQHLKERASAFPLLTYTELKFIESEAQLRLGDKEKSYNAYQTAIRSALNQASIFNTNSVLTSTQIENYLSRAKVKVGVDKFTLTDIITQKYIFHFTFQSSEAYNDIRRTALLKMSDPDGTPKRYPYPQSEISRNGNAPQNSNEQFVYTDAARLFWAKL